MSCCKRGLFVYQGNIQTIELAHYYSSSRSGLSDFWVARVFMSLWATYAVWITPCGTPPNPYHAVCIPRSPPTPNLLAVGSLQPTGHTTLPHPQGCGRKEKPEEREPRDSSSSRVMRAQYPYKEPRSHRLAPWVLLAAHRLPVSPAVDFIVPSYP